MSYHAKRQKGLSLQEHFDRGIYPSLSSREERFPEGESLEDVARRAEQAVEDILLSHVELSDGKGRNVAVVSHGIFIRELVSALFRRRRTSSTQSIESQGFHGLRNTAWTRIVVSLDVSGLQLARLCLINMRRPSRMPQLEKIHQLWSSKSLQ